MSKKLKNLKMRYKTLIDNINKEFIVLIPLPNDVFIPGTCSTPELYPMTSTLEALIKYYPTIDFSEISIVEVEINLVD